MQHGGTGRATEAKRRRWTGCTKKERKPGIVARSGQSVSQRTRSDTGVTTRGPGRWHGSTNAALIPRILPIKGRYSTKAGRVPAPASPTTVGLQGSDRPL